MRVRPTRTTPSIALSGHSGLLAKVVVAVDAFGEFVAGGFVSAVVADISELAAARFLRWRFFFAAFFEIIVVSMVTKKGRSCVQCLQTKGLGGQSLETEY